MKSEEKQAWLGHLCGVCLALRDNFGQVSRIATNYDAALLSVLCEAQTPEGAEKLTSYCPLRNQFKAEVVAPGNIGSKYAASMALMMASTRIQDHLEDGETVLRHVPGISTGIARNWSQVSQKMAAGLGFDAGAINRQTHRQTEIEAQPGGDFLFYARPTELAVGAAFRHTAIIANQLQNADILYEMGRMFGRMMYLLDSYQDYATDLAAGKFNALAACFTEADMPRQASQIFQQAYHQLKHLFFSLNLPQPTLARKLLIHQLRQTGFKTLEIGECPPCGCYAPLSATTTTGAGFNFRRRRRRFRRRPRRGPLACCTAIICCDWCTDCCCCCDFDCCECGEGECELCDCDCCGCECCELECCECD